MYWWNYILCLKSQFSFVENLGVNNELSTIPMQYSLKQADISIIDFMLQMHSAREPPHCWEVVSDRPATQFCHLTV